MKSLRLLMSITACCVTGTLLAAEPAPSKTPPAPTAAPAAESATRKGDEDPKGPDAKQQDPQAQDPNTEDGKAPAAKPKSAASAADKASPQRFVPSEQVRADFDVSFPIDI